MRGSVGWQGRKEGIRCAEVRSENTENKRTNQKGEIAILFAIVAIQDDVGFMRLILSSTQASFVFSLLPLLLVMYSFIQPTCAIGYSFVLLSLSSTLQTTLYLSCSHDFLCLRQFSILDYSPIQRPNQVMSCGMNPRIPRTPVSEKSCFGLHRSPPESSSTDGKVRDILDALWMLEQCPSKLVLKVSRWTLVASFPPKSFFQTERCDGVLASGIWPCARNQDKIFFFLI